MSTLTTEPVSAPPEPSLPGIRLAHRRAIKGRLWSHFSRAMGRFAVLVLADYLAISTYRWLFGQDLVQAAFGSWIQSWVGVRFELAVGVILALVVLGAYRTGDRWRSLRRIYTAAAMGLALLNWPWFWTPPSDGVSLAIQLVLATAALGTLITLGRMVLDVGVLLWRSRDGGAREAVLLVAPGDIDVDEVAGGVPLREGGRFRVVGSLTIEEGYSGPWVLKETLDALDRLHTPTIVVAGYLSQDAWSAVVEAADVAGCRLLSMGRHGMGLQAVRQTSYQGVPFTEITTPHLQLPQMLAKRAFDLVMSAVLLIVLSPLMVGIALAVKLTSPGPVFFRQERLGQGGRRFRIIKFRSMNDGADSEKDDLEDRSIYPDARLFKVRDDPRVTPLGAWLRHTSLDELPQLFNVLMGDMSLVGPRPPVPREVLHYDEHHYLRFDVPPGITGPWQVAGRNKIQDFEEVILIEQEYIRNWSLGRDLRILLQTIPVVIRRQGAH